jgi:hypothetical protein
MIVPNNKNAPYMKSLLPALLCLLFTNQLKAQPPQFRWNQANTKPGPQVNLKLYGQSDAGFYVVNEQPPTGTQFSPTLTLEYFNAGMERVYVKNITPPALEDYVGMAYLDKQCWLFTALFDKASGKNTLYAGSFGADGTPLTRKAIATLDASRLADRGLFTLSVSPDRSKLVVLSQPDYVKNEQEKIGIHLFDGQFNKLWSSVQTYPYAWTRAVYNQPAVNNTGMVFILKKTDMQAEGNTWSVFSCNGKTMKEYPIALDGRKKATPPVSNFAPNGDLAVGGYYTEDAKVKVGFGKAFQGSYLQRLNASGEKAEFTVVTPFEKRKDILPRQLLFDKGNTLLLGEEYFVTEQAVSDPARKAADPFARDYHYNGKDIYIDAFDASGKLRYSTGVKKNNDSQNDNGTGLSFFGALVQDKLQLLFNDEAYRYDEEKKAVYFGGTPKIIVRSTLDPESGKALPTEPVGNTEPVGGKKGDMLLRPDTFLRLSETEFLMRAENNKIYRMGKMNF